METAPDSLDSPEPGRPANILEHFRKSHFYLGENRDVLKCLESLQLFSVGDGWSL